MMFWAIKPIYRRDKMLYEVQCDHFDSGNVAGAVQAGFYVTDNLAATLGRIVAGKCPWYDKLNTRAQDAIRSWLMQNV